jgi:hypothetical protein
MIRVLAVCGDELVWETVEAEGFQVDAIGTLLLLYKEYLVEARAAGTWKRAQVV